MPDTPGVLRICPPIKLCGEVGWGSLTNYHYLVDMVYLGILALANSHNTLTFKLFKLPAQYDIYIPRKDDLCQSSRHVVHTREEAQRHRTFRGTFEFLEVQLE
jgi:hypothetical protein